MQTRYVNQVLCGFVSSEFEALSQLPPEELEKQIEEIRKRQEEGTPPQSPFNLHTLFWILATVCICYFTDFLPSIQHNQDVKR